MLPGCAASTQACSHRPDTSRSGAHGTHRPGAAKDSTVTGCGANAQFVYPGALYSVLHRLPSWEMGYLIHIAQPQHGHRSGSGRQRPHLLQPVVYRADACWRSQSFNSVFLSLSGQLRSTIERSIFQSYTSRSWTRCLFVCLFGLRCSGSLWWMSPYQGWTLHYLKAGRRGPLCAPETDPSLCRVPGEFAVSGLLWVADWPPDRSLSLLRLACWVEG